MEDHQEFVDDDLLELINWDNLTNLLPQSADSLFPDSSSLDFSPSSSWMEEIENILMKDDDDGQVHLLDSTNQFCDDFLADVLVHSPSDSSAPRDVLDASTDKDDSSCGAQDENLKTEKEKEEAVEEFKVIDDASEDVNNDADEDPNDPISMKRRRQLRNRDAAVRSRERKKTYVRDLEIKSKYLEAECRRLGRLLQCFVAENQALRFSLHKGGASGVTWIGQESAVLLLESLLLGSLLWFLGIMCLFSLPPMSPSTMVEDPLESVEKKAPENVAPRGAGREMFIKLTMGSFVNSRKCKGSRARMRAEFFHLRVLV